MVSFHFIEHSHYFLILHCLHLFVSFFLTSLKNCSSFRPHRRWIFPGNHTPSATNVKWSVKGFKEKVHFYPLTLHQITTNLMNKEVEEVFKSLWPHNSSPLLPPTMEKSFTITSVRWEGLWGNCHKSYLVCPLEAIMSEDSLEIIKGWSCLFFFSFQSPRNSYPWQRKDAWVSQKASSFIRGSHYLGSFKRLKTKAWKCKGSPERKAVEDRPFLPAQPPALQHLPFPMSGEREQALLSVKFGVLVTALDWTF